MRVFIFQVIDTAPLLGLVNIFKLLAHFIRQDSFVRFYGLALFKGG